LHLYKEPPFANPSALIQHDRECVWGGYFEEPSKLERIASTFDELHNPHALSIIPQHTNFSLQGTLSLVRVVDGNPDTPRAVLVVVRDAGGHDILCLEGTYEHVQQLMAREERVELSQSFRRTEILETRGALGLVSARGSEGRVPGIQGGAGWR